MGHQTLCASLLGAESHQRDCFRLLAEMPRALTCQLLVVQDVQMPGHVTGVHAPAGVCIPVRACPSSTA